VTPNQPFGSLCITIRCRPTSLTGRQLGPGLVPQGRGLSSNVGHLNMHTADSIKKISDIVASAKNPLPEKAGVYAFWWVSTKSQLMAANRHIKLKGPGEKLVDVEFKDWWPAELVYPCLYVGKTTNIRKRFYQHILRGSPDRRHTIPASNEKQKPVTTACQLRYGIEHVFKSDAAPLKIIYDKVGFSYSINFTENAIAERFFTEDRLIGTWRPWFNIDSER
jgi:hypothetical protein